MGQSATARAMLAGRPLTAARDWFAPVLAGALSSAMAEGHIHAIFVTAMVSLALSLWASRASAMSCREMAADCSFEVSQQQLHQHLRLAEAPVHVDRRLPVQQRSHQGHLAQVRHRSHALSFHGSTMSIPQSAKSERFRVASEAPREAAIAAICASAWEIGRPERRRAAAIRA
jgi:hypothetical protein